MTKAEQHRRKAKSFIDDAIEKSKKSYNSLMSDLGVQLEKWKDQHRTLSYVNLFDLTEEQSDRKNYLDALIVQSELILSKHRRKNIGSSSKGESVITITGNNLSIKWN